jgi:hypothetical protein
MTGCSKTPGSIFRTPGVSRSPVVGWCADRVLIVYGTPAACRCLEDGRRFGVAIGRKAVLTGLTRSDTPRMAGCARASACSRPGIKRWRVGGANGRRATRPGPDSSLFRPHARRAARLQVEYCVPDATVCEGLSWPRRFRPRRRRGNHESERLRPGPRSALDPTITELAAQVRPPSSAAARYRGALRFRTSPANRGRRGAVNSS